MRMFPSTPSILVVLVCLLPLVGCEQVPEEGAKLSIDDGWAAVQQAHADLDAKRAQLAALPEDGEGEGEGEPTPRQTLEAELDVQSRAFSDQLVDFINGSGMVEGEPLNEIQQAAIRLKSSEDILVAEQYITSRANYNRAIEIYNGALMLDPDNEALTTALAHAESMRY
ncbi:MAG: hypothetical protein OEV00_10820, partial [Acidobacteriota bacterium]|nr:hypothetical protein [Acidobacteriota bacterium]